MPRFQDRRSGNLIDQYPVPETRNKSDLQAEVVDIETVSGLTDGELEALIVLGQANFHTADEFRAHINDVKDRVLQQIRLWELDTQVINFDELIATFLYFDPALNGAVESVCGEELGNEATEVLQNSGKWRHNTNHTHEIVLDLGNPEVLDAINIPLEVGANNSHQLRNVDVFAAKLLSNIDELQNQMLTSVDFVNVGADNIHVFVNPKGGSTKKARYVKLTNIDTDHPTNIIRVREILVRVIPRFFFDEE